MTNQEIMAIVAASNNNQAGDLLAQLIAHRIKTSGDVTNILSAIMQGLRNTETSKVEGDYFKICDSAIAGAWVEIHHKQLDAKQVAA